MFTERTEVIVESISPLKLKVALVNILYKEIVTLRKKPDEKHASLGNVMNQPKHLVFSENNKKDLEESLSL